MKTYTLITLFCFLSLISCKENNTHAQSSSVKKVVNEKIITANFKVKIEHKDVQLVDVRTPKEYKEGHITNAKNINFFDDDFLTQMDVLDKNKALYIYCRSGNRSGKAASKLIALGFIEIYDLKGGFLDWQKNKLPSVKD